jgi:hypothetical protein
MEINETTEKDDFEREKRREALNFSKTEFTKQENILTNIKQTETTVERILRKAKDGLTPK